ncbi:MAG TPA: TolC family protein [Anaeromyxobacteraceae bacterium]|nr:TolC family protein [Anaeromyxobacteraceae bacterium]
MTARAALLLLVAAAPPGGTVSLEDAIRTALANQPQVLQARAGAEAAAARADQARAPLLPQIGGSLSYRRGTANTPESGPTSWAGQDLWTAGATASQLVWDFGQTTGRWDSARESAGAQRDGERHTALQVVLGVRTAFFTARASKDLVGVARETLANQEAHLRQIRGFVEVGTRPEIDLAQARTDRANAQVQLINAENAYQTARARLNQAMGTEGPADYDVADDTMPAVEGEDQPLEALLAEAIRARPDVASLEGQVRAQRATLGSATAGHFPSLGVAAGIGDSGPEPARAVANWNATATLTWNFFQGGLTAAQVREARATLVGIEAQLAALRQQVRLDVDQAARAVRAAGAALSAAGEALLNARERLRLAEGRYQTGKGSIIELGDAQVALTAAGAQRVQADYALASARAQLLEALGRPAGPGAEAPGR